MMKCAPSDPAKSAAARVRAKASARVSFDRRGQPAAPELRVEVQPGRDAVDVVLAERVTHLVEVLLPELLRVVELVAVDQVAEPVHGAANPLGRGLVRPLRLVAGGDESRHHRPEGPDPEAGLHPAFLLLLEP